MADEISVLPQSHKNNPGVDTAAFYVTAILVTHDGASWLPEVIASLASQTRRIDRIIAVDTGSMDSSLKLLSSAGITVIKAERDLGFGSAIDLALEQSPALDEFQSTGREFIWLIHDDCAPAKDALALMLEAVSERPQVAIAGPKLLGWYDRDHLLEAGISIAPNGARWTGLERREQNQGQYDETKDVLSVSTAAMLIRRNAFEELGGLDPNLALFRDDIDFGWRARVRGFGAICVGAASAFHAEASASERRSVDVSEAFLHRPLLLDRRNAAYVMLANSSWWVLPWVALQLLGTSLLRVLFDLLAKLPGYAGDEIAAVALLLIHPTDLIKARRDRRKKRLLSPSVISGFIPPRGSQFRAGIDRVASTISARLKGEVVEDRQEFQDETALSYSDIGLIPEEFDELYQPTRPSIIKGILKRPDSISLIVILILSLIASRDRFGTLSGGALGFVPVSGGDLLRSYAQAWHIVGMGSAAASPPWVAILGIASILTLGHLSLFVTTLFFLAPSLAFIIMVNVLRKVGRSKGMSIVGGVFYVLTPLLWSALNQGRIDILALYLLAPIFVLVKPFMINMHQLSWRRIFAQTLLATLVCSFSPLILGVWLVVQLAIWLKEFWSGIRTNNSATENPKAGWIEFLEGENLKPAIRRLVVILTTILLTVPWSLDLFIHPTEFLVAPGIPLANGGTLQTVLTNPGGIGSPTWWIIAPTPLFILFSWFVPTLQKVAGYSSAILAVAILLDVFHVTGHGATEPVYVGTAFLAINIILIPPMTLQMQNLLPNLRLSNVGLGHISIALASVLTVASVAGMTGWVFSGQSKSAVVSDQSEIIPAFLSSLAQSPARPKTLVLDPSGNPTTFFISRGDPIAIGDADVAAATPPQISNAIDQLVVGAAVDAGKVFGEYGIQYLFIKAPVPADLARIIDGVGGFTRLSSTSIGTVWRIVGAAPRVLLATSSTTRDLVPSLDIGTQSTIPSAGTVSLAETYDHNWRLIVNGNNVPLQRGANGLPTFQVSEPGSVTILFDGTLHRGLISLELLALLVSIVMALPSGRRRKQVPLEELV